MTDKHIEELNAASAYYMTWHRRWRAEIITGLIWAVLFVLLLPFEFRECAWPWLTVKILAAVIGSALLPLPVVVLPVYLVLKSN